jgi:hypothetical protein
MFYEQSMVITLNILLNHPEIFAEVIRKEMPHHA